MQSKTSISSYFKIHSKIFLENSQVQKNAIFIFNLNYFVKILNLSSFHFLEKNKYTSSILVQSQYNSFHFQVFIITNSFILLQILSSFVLISSSFTKLFSFFG